MKNICREQNREKIARGIDDGSPHARRVRQRKKEIAVRAEMGGESQETAPETAQDNLLQDESEEEAEK